MPHVTHTLPGRVPPDEQVAWSIPKMKCYFIALQLQFLLQKVCDQRLLVPEVKGELGTIKYSIRAEDMSSVSN